MKFLLARYVWDDITGLLYKTIEAKQFLCIPRVKDRTLHSIPETHDTPQARHNYYAKLSKTPPLIHTARQSRKSTRPFQDWKENIQGSLQTIYSKRGYRWCTSSGAHCKIEKIKPTQEKFLNRKTYEVPQPIKDSEDVTIYLVDDILSLKWERKKRFFLIKWEGYDDPTWEKEDILRESPDFIPHLEEYYLQRVQNNIQQPLRASKRKNPKARFRWCLRRLILSSQTN